MAGVQNLPEKELKTRIQLKYDTYDNWMTKSSLVLKKGEIAIAEISNAVAGSQLPPVMFKVGNGSKTFKDLDWVSAKAADVYAWAKQSEEDFVNNFLSLKTANDVTMETMLEGVFATDEELSAAIGDLRDEINAKIGDLNKLETTEKSDLVSAINEVLNAVEVGGTGSVVTVEKDAAASTGSFATYTVKQGDKAVGSKIEIPQMVYNDDGETINLDDHDTMNAVLDLNINGNTIVAYYGEFATAKGLNNAKEELIGDANDDKDASTICGAKALADGLYRAVLGTEADAAGTATVHGALNAAAGALSDAKDYVDGKFTEANLDQYTTEDEVKTIVDDVIKTATDKETLDSLVELVEYIDKHSGEAINMATAISTLEDKVETIEEKPAYDIAATQVSNWDNEVGAKALAGTKLDAATYNTYVQDHANDYTNKQIDDAIDADVKAAIDAEVLRANGAYDAKGAASDVQAALIGQADDDKTKDTIIGARRYADSLAVNYATAAQGALADSALQEITTTANGGLKVTNKNQIDIDTGVVFVFNCGDSSEFTDK